VVDKPPAPFQGSTIGFSSLPAEAARSAQQSPSQNTWAAGFQPPSINLPKGGGAIRGIGEKFSANPVTGTGSMTIPIATSPGRSGFGPQLSLNYDSGAGNGSFGFGWTLSAPSITRKTEKGLPQYRDAEDSDVFILSGTEDLVPVFRQDPDGTWVAGHLGYQRDVEGAWVHDASGRFVVHEDEVDGYRVRRYRPRIEGLFARIERWSKIGSPSDVHWRSISKDNILTIYGLDSNSRIADPLDANRIFSWLICETRDDKGNAVLYRYKAEDGLGVKLDAAHERNRGPRNDPRRTANRCLKRIYYGNRVSSLDNAGRRPHFLDKAQIDAQIANALWMFEVVFDYADHDEVAPEPNDDTKRDTAGSLKYSWKCRPDPFSSYRSGFEIRTMRLCRRALMFHHFPCESEVGRDCLVRSTDFTYSDEIDPTDARNPVYSFLRKVTQNGYRRNNGDYISRSLPAVEFEYSEPIVQDKVEEVDPSSLQNLPVGLDGSAYRWLDLYGEGVPGILTEHGDTWYYKRNLSPIHPEPNDSGELVQAHFAPLETVALKPNASLRRGAEVTDLAGDGQPDVVMMKGPTPGLYEHDDAEGWQPFRPFRSQLNRDLDDPNLKFVDLDGDGHTDILISEDDGFVWHASLAEDGFGPGRRLAHALDEEKGPRIVFADGTQSIYLADFSGDGLSDIGRIRNGEICYWPNLGYGRFGAKITMDNATYFDQQDQFDHRRIRLADIDGSGTTDIIYLHRDGVRLYFNQSGNNWSSPHPLKVFPHLDDLVSIMLTDLLGNGTTCLVWSSPLPQDAGRPMRYVNLMGSRKPHLLINTVNNLGAETSIDYAPSTKFYLRDKRDGRPWITRLAFPTYVVERVRTYDHVSRNRFVTCYAYHHGYFDGDEREFRGFGMVEQWDTEVVAALGGNNVPPARNIDAASDVPPVHTRTWFHTGAYFGYEQISRQFGQEYFREPQDWLLRDTVLPGGLTADEEREACRALKGMMLRQEVYTDDGTAKESIPYTAVEQNFTVERCQPRSGDRHGVFLSYPREAITYHYERDSSDPRVQHALTLQADSYGNVVTSAIIGYGRRVAAIDSNLTPKDWERQRLIHVTYSHNTFTKPIDTPAAYRTPMFAESRTYEFRKPQQEVTSTRATLQYDFDTLLNAINEAEDGSHNIEYEDLLFAKAQQAVARSATERDKYFRRLIEHVRTIYRADDLTRLLPLGEAGTLALAGETYKLAFTPGLLAQVFRRNGQSLLPTPAALLGGQGADRGGYIVSQALKTAGIFPSTDPNDYWWIPAGSVFLSANENDTPTNELAYAVQHFFLPHRYRDPFGKTTILSYDSGVANPQKNYNLLIVETRDALANTVTATNDYRTLQPTLMSDPNGNRTEVQFDALGMVVGTAIMGKASGPIEGDSFGAFTSDLTAQEIADYFGVTDPRALALQHLGTATTRIIYDLNRIPACAATIAREAHVSDLTVGAQAKVQLTFSYSDGFGREMQKKIQAEPGPGPKRDVNGRLIIDANGEPLMTPENLNTRWVGTGWTIFNNKGKPILQFESFFSDTHRLDTDAQIGVSSVLCYDPADRVVATLHANHTWEKVVFDPWRQETWDANDTVVKRDPVGGTITVFDPSTDEDVGEYFSRLPGREYAPTWYALRAGAEHIDELNARYPDATDRTHETMTATITASHANTPTTAYLDTLGRTFLTLAHNGFKPGGIPDCYPTRVEFDIEGNQRAIRDAIVEANDPEGRIVVLYDYDMVGNRICQTTIDGGERWMLNDVMGKSICVWDSRGHNFWTEYDDLRRPTRQFVRGSDANRSDPRTLNKNLLFEQVEYGEHQTNATLLNLRTRVFKQYDNAGVVTHGGYNPVTNRDEAYDFKGNPRLNGRQLIADQKPIPDWAQSPVLDATLFTTRTRYDALNRPIEITTPDASVIRPAYNQANLLERIEAKLPGVATMTTFVSNINYNAKGQRILVDYGNGATTRYDYDRRTSRLAHILTQRDVASFPADCPQTPASGWPGCCLQNLHYTYDPVGNITHIRDDAQQTLYFRNQRVEPSTEYRYDAIYRLIQAIGREHVGQAVGTASVHSYNDAFRVRQPHPGDGKAMWRYCEEYTYDAVGNIMEMIHGATCPGSVSWRRSYIYGETSLIEGDNLHKSSNRLSSTQVGNGTAAMSEPYAYDDHGSMLQMPQLQIMQWDFKNQLLMTQRQAVNLADVEGMQRQGERTYYVYDATGQRVRKVTELASGSLKEERIYLGIFELYRQHVGPNAGLERISLHIMDERQRIASVETEVTPKTAAPVIRYQFGNHLGSSSLELDALAKIISYEEYTPYGSTSYQAGRSPEVSLKRYRYVAKERDEESGLYYHGARYYASWLARWVSCDPLGVQAGVNMTTYGSLNPVRFSDKNGLAPEDEVKPDPREAAKQAVQKVKEMVTTHLQKLKAGEDSPYGGSLADYGDKTPENLCGCLTFPEESLESYFSYYIKYYEDRAEKTAGRGPLMQMIWAVDNLEKAADIQQRYSAVLGDYERSDKRGTALLKSLHDKEQWKTVYVATSKEDEKIEKSKNVRKEGVYPAHKQTPEAFKTPVDYFIERLDKPKSQGAASKYNLNQLRKVSFGIGVVESGRHTFVLSYGKVYEVHWEENSRSAKLFEVSTLEKFMSDWKQSAVIAFPGALLEKENIKFK
jgi:RHS repeat-associated protein